MDKVKLQNDLDIIDYIVDNNEDCKGRKIFTDKKMVEKLKTLTEDITIKDKTTHLNIVCSQTGNLTEVDLVQEGTNCFWLKDVKADDIESIAPVDTNKEPIYIVNEVTKEK